MYDRQLRDKHHNESSERKLVYLFFLVFWFFPVTLLVRNSHISKNQLEKLEVTLLKKPEFTSGKVKFYTLITEEYVDCKFRISESALKAINSFEFKRDVRGGDKLTLLRKKNDDGYDFWGKGPQLIEIYGVSKDSIDYINLEQLNIEQRENELTGGIIGIVLSIISLIYLVWDERIPYDYGLVVCITLVVLIALFVILDYYNLLVN